jgi:hypothetical protein
MSPAYAADAHAKAAWSAAYAADAAAHAAVDDGDYVDEFAACAARGAAYAASEEML